MIRRGFWLVSGAVLGVTGYRKVNKLARSLTTGVPSAGSPAISTAAIGRYAARTLPALVARQQARAERRQAFARRQQELAEARQDGLPAARQGGLPAGRHALPANQRSFSQQNPSGGAAGFVKDVREGMAEYWDLHRRDFDRTLGGQSGRDESGASQRGVR